MRGGQADVMTERDKRVTGVNCKRFESLETLVDEKLLTTGSRQLGFRSPFLSARDLRQTCGRRMVRRESMMCESVK